MDDDFELEVTDLRTGRVLKTARDFPASAQIPALAPEGDDRDFELEVTKTSLSSLLPATGAHGTGILVTPPRQRPPRRRMIGAIATGALIVVVLVGLLSGIVGEEGFGFGLFPTPVPSATLAEGDDTFYIVNGVPWGKLLADGKLMNVDYSQQQPTFFGLPRGRHAIEYDAPPFPKVTCTVSVPAAQSDSCSIYTPPNGAGTQWGILDTYRGLDLGETLSKLPPDILQALVNAAAQNLAAPISTTAVPVGGRYQGANGKVLVATEPLRAQIFYTLNTDSSRISGMFGGNCVSLCELSFGEGTFGTGTAEDGNDWQIAANIVPIWHYTNAAGATVQLPATPQVPSAPIYQSGGPGDFLILAVSWQGADGWQAHPIASTFTPNLACFDAENALGQVQALITQTNGGSITSEADAPNPADGCLIAIGASNNDGGLIGKPMWFLYRFGLVFAANPAAHQLIPSLPIAQGSEAKLAQQLATQLSPPFNG